MATLSGSSNASVAFSAFTTDDAAESDLLLPEPEAKNDQTNMVAEPRPRPAFAFFETFVGFGNVSGAPGPPGPQTRQTPVLLIEAPADPAAREELYNPGGRGYELCAIISSFWPRATYFAFGRVVDRMPSGGRVAVIRHTDYSAKIE